MAGRIERVAPGAPAEVALAAEIRRVQEADRLAPVWVVVGGPITGLSLRRRLAGDGAFAAVRFSSLHALIQQIADVRAAAGGGGRRPLNQVALRAAARVALAEVPGLLGPVARHPATEASLATTYQGLRRASEADLDRLAAESGRAADIVALARAIRVLLESGYYDRFDLIEAAIATLEGPAAGVSLEGIPGGAELGDVGTVIVYLPDPLFPEETRLLACLARRLDVLVLAGRTGDEAADRSVDRFVEILAERFGVLPAGDGHAASTELASELASELATASGRFGGLLSAPDDDVEVREAVRNLVAHAEAGGDLGRCVVTFPDGGRSAGIGRRVAEQLTAAGIPYCGERQILGDSPQAKLVLGLVALAVPALPGHELDRGQVMAWLAGGPIRTGGGLTRGLAAGDRDASLPAGAWDRCSRSAGVISGIDQWRGCLQAMIARSQERHADRPSRTANTATELLEFIERLHALITAAVSAQSWEALCAWSEHALEELLEPGDDRSALSDALCDLSLLDDLDPLGRLPVSERLRRFAAAAEVAFERPVGERGRYGVGPVIGPLSEVANLRADLVLVLGCREGDLPGRRFDDPLVPRAEREHIDTLVQPERVDTRARRHLISVLSAAGSSQVSFARIDVRAGRTAYPSPWAAELFGGRATDVPSFAGSIKRVTEGMAAAADLTDFELASLQDRSSESRHWLDRVNADYGRRRTSILRRSEGGLNPFAGYVPAAGAAADAWSSPLSATGLESFAKCPFLFFVRNKLGVSKLEQPERLVMIDPRDRGTLMHEVLEGFFGVGEACGPNAGFDDEALDRLRTLARAVFEEFERSGKTGKVVFWHTERARILRDLERYVARDIAESAAASRVPIDVEFEFGGEGREVNADIAGRQVTFRGRIDRVDLMGGERLVVVDYKSGSSFDYQDILKDPLGRGRHLQLPIYAKAAVDVLGPTMPLVGPARAEYRFLQAGASYAVIPIDLTEDVNAELHHVLETFVATIDAGCFPPRPGAPAQGFQYDNCKYCDFDALCTNDRAELWERASGDHEMKAYTELATGPA